jgi:hypothetical protein
MEELASMLQTAIPIKADPQAECSLMNQKALRRILRFYEDGALTLDIQQQEYGLPLYYLCKVQDDYHCTYNSVLRDFYISPGYTFHDNRLMKLMDYGHQMIYLRLSPFREKLIQFEKVEGQGNIEKELSRIGSQVLQYAWHEDQNIGIYCSDKFGLPNFRCAIELVYLCLTADLCDLRSNIDGLFLTFFSQIYPQPAIHGFLTSIQNSNDLPVLIFQEKAKRNYTNLLRAFNKLLACNVSWGIPDQKIPLYKLVFANMFRLEMVWEDIKDNPVIKQAAFNLEETALTCIREINILSS